MTNTHSLSIMASVRRGGIQWYVVLLQQMHSKQRKLEILVIWVSLTLAILWWLGQTVPKTAAFVRFSSSAAVKLAQEGERWWTFDRLNHVCAVSEVRRLWFDLLSLKLLKNFKLIQSKRFLKYKQWSQLYTPSSSLAFRRLPTLTHPLFTLNYADDNLL